MSTTEHRDGEGVPQQYDWRAYETPTKTTAHVLEELVGAGEESPKSHKTKSSSTGSFVVVEPQTQGTQNKAPLTPLPIYPPTYHPESASESTTPPPPPHPPSKSESDVTENEERSMQFRRARDSISSNNPRRMSDERRAHPRNAESPKGTTHTATTTTTTTGTSPTDSHPQRFHTHAHNHNHTRTHAKSRSSSESLSSLLLVTTERLSRETARANEAERNAAEVMNLFKNTYEAKVKLERDLIRVQQELELYKVQLNVAQKEIYRAQDVVDRVDRERVAAQEEAARARDKIHKLTEARAIQLAMEEGRRSGFEEGLRQGRRVQPVREPLALPEEGTRHRHSKSDEVSRYTYPELDPSPSSHGTRHRRRSSSRPPPPAHPESPGSKLPPHRPEAVPTIQPLPVPPTPSSAPPPPTTHRHGTPPDVGTFQNLLPRPTITTPMPVQVPSTQPQPPPPMPPHQAAMAIHDHHPHHQHQPQQQHRPSQPLHPEKIAVQPTSNGGGRIHPIPVWNATPSVMHERIDLPPDNYIPTMDANSMVISLPPPHELSRPVRAPAEAPPPPHVQAQVPVAQVQVPVQPQTQKNLNGKRGSLRLVDHDEREMIKSRDYGHTHTYDYDYDREREKARREDEGQDDDGASSLRYSTLSGPRDQSSRQKYATTRSRRAPAASLAGSGWGVLSPRTSTHLSDLDLLSPPRDGHSPMTEEGRYYHKRYENPVQRLRADDANVNAATPSPPQRIAQEWRDANREFVTPPSKTIDPPRPTSAAAAASIPRPPSRRAREVVMPVPLADVFMNTLKSPPLDGQPFSDRTTPQTMSGSNGEGAGAVPGIEVVTPSTHASTRLSLRTIVDPVLLSPESANRPLPLPDQPRSRPQSTQPQPVVRQEDGTYFVPMSPISGISGMTDLKPYPPGFAPSLPQEHMARGGDFKYPSSPLRR